MYGVASQARKNTLSSPTGIGGQKPAFSDIRKIERDVRLYTEMQLPSLLILTT